MNAIEIASKPLEIKEYKGQRVVTLKDIDAVHGRPEGTARRNFNINKKHFIGGEDFYKICADEIRTNKIMAISSKTHQDVILITESGYLMLVKSFTDDLAWEVQRQLVKNYFRNDVPAKEEQLTLPVEHPYQYRKRTYNGKLVFTVADMVHFTGLSKDQIQRVLKRHGLEFWDYYELKRTELIKFKMENHDSGSTASHMTIITQEGVKKLCDTFNIDLVMPELVPMKKPAQTVQPPSDAMIRLMGYVQQETEEIQAAVRLLKSTDTKEHFEVYRHSLLNHMVRLRDLRFAVETILI